MRADGIRFAAYVRPIYRGDESGKQTRMQLREIQRAFINHRRDQFSEIDYWQEELIDSQAAIEARPCLLEIVELAMLGELDEVAVYSENCLSSDPLEFFSIQRTLEEHSVKLLVVMGGKAK